MLFSGKLISGGTFGGHLENGRHFKVSVTNWEIEPNILQNHIIDTDITKLTNTDTTL